MKQYITNDMLIGDMIEKSPIAARALMEAGMGCVSCPAAQMETLEEACGVHGLPVDQVREDVNTWVATLEELLANNA